MIATLIGKDKFRKGMDKYFELYDGQAVTTEDFVHAMEVASGRDLTQFKNWYSRPGTPTLKISSKLEGEILKIEIEQKYPPTTLTVPEGNVLHMPLRVGLIYQDGQQEEKNLELNSLKQCFEFKVKEKPILSLNRGFSAPVLIEYEYSFSELVNLMAVDQDPYCRYEATQKVYDQVFKADYNHYLTSGDLKKDLSAEFVGAFERLLKDSSIDLAFKAYLLDLPTQSGLAQEMINPDFDAIAAVHKNLRAKLGLEFGDWFLQEHQRLSTTREFALTPKAFGERSLKNQLLNYLVASNSSAALKRLEEHYQHASNMTEEIAGLSLYVKTGAGLDHPAVKSFYQKWKNDSLVMIKWFGSLSAQSPKESAVKRLEALEQDPLFKKDVPNYLRALYMQFAKNNLQAFHAEDGSGYHFVAERIKQIDKFNPQVASRLASSFSMINKVDQTRQAEMKKALQSIMDNMPSRDTFEVVSTYLAQ